MRQNDTHKYKHKRAHWWNGSSERKRKKRWQNIGVKNAFDIRTGHTAHETQFNKLLEHVQIIIGFCILRFSFDIRCFLPASTRKCAWLLSTWLFMCCWFALGFRFQFQVIGHAIPIMLSLNVIHLTRYCS